MLRQACIIIAVPFRYLYYVFRTCREFEHSLVRLGKILPEPNADVTPLPWIPSMFAPHYEHIDEGLERSPFMGMITVSIKGSFNYKEEFLEDKEFSAQEYGHADAVARAIEYLSGVVLPRATFLDHKLQTGGHLPDKGFEREEPQ